MLQYAALVLIIMFAEVMAAVIALIYRVKVRLPNTFFFYITPGRFHTRHIFSYLFAYPHNYSTPFPLNSTFNQLYLSINLSNAHTVCLSVCLYAIVFCCASIWGGGGSRVGSTSTTGDFAFGTLAIPLTLLCQCLSDETLKAVGPFYLVSMPGKVKDPTSPHWNV